VLEEIFGVSLTVRRLADPKPPPTPNRLTVGNTEVLRHRRVELLAGDRIVSKAELWWVPDRLPGQLVEVLETTDIPFGRVMRPLGLKRWVFCARFSADPEVALEHRALLSRPGGLPVAEVLESYPRTLFGGS
jgi:chorismate-pyruvate lyase